MLIYGVKHHIFIFSLVGLFVLPTWTLAATFAVEKEDEGAVTITEPVVDDLYTAGNEVTVEAAVEGDAMLAGRNVSIKADVTQDIYAAGEKLLLEGSVGDDLHAAGSEIVLQSNVVGDAFLAGDSVTVQPEAQIGHDAFLGGNTITIAGTVEGTVRAAGSTITIAETAVINGDLITYGEAEPAVAEGATIRGARHHREGRQPAPVSGPGLIDWVRAVVTLFITAMALHFFMPRFTASVLEQLKTRPGVSVVTGLLWVILFIPVLVVLMISVIGWQLAIILVGLALILFTAASAYAALALGGWVMGKLSPREVGATASPADIAPLGWSHALLGAVIFEAVRLLGGIGWLATFVFLIFVFGAVIRADWAVMRSLK